MAAPHGPDRPFPTSGVTMLHRTMLAAAAAATLCSAAVPSLAAELPVHVDPRVEAVGIVCRLAGYDEWKKPTIASYDGAAMRWFAPQAAHPAVALARTLRAERGIAYNAPVGLALALDPVTFEPLVPLWPRPGFLDARWDSASAYGFAAALRAFARDARLAEFLAAQQVDVAAVEREFDRRLGSALDLDWFRRVYGFGEGTRLTVVPALFSREGNYGAHVVLGDGTFIAYQVLAVPSARRASDLHLSGDGLFGLAAHELSHPFVNPWVDAHLDQLLPSGRTLFAATESEMRANAYGAPEVLLYETVVRAQAIRWAREHGHGGLAKAMAAEDRRRAFAWTGELADTLAAAGRLDAAAAPRVAACLATWASEARARLEQSRANDAAAAAEAARTGPQVTHLVPANGATDVAAGEGVLEIAFDREMNGAVSLMGDTPEVIGAPTWNAGHTVFSVRVRFDSGRTYVLGLNSPADLGFRSKAGEALTPREWRFTVK